MTKPASVQKLGSNPLFAGLSAVQLAAMAEASRERSYDKDALVFMKGDQPTVLFAVLAGKVKLACQSPLGGERVIDLLGPGQVFGEAALLLDCPYPYCAAALLPRTQLLHIESHVLQEFISVSPGFSLRLLSQLAHGVCTVISDLEDYLLRTPQQRIARFLLDGCTTSASAPNGCVMAFPAAKHVVASRLGMTPETLSRCLHDMLDAGLIQVSKCCVSVLDKKKLKRLLD